jgi:hypothetical protein
MSGFDKNEKNIQNDQEEPQFLEELLDHTGTGTGASCRIPGTYLFVQRPVVDLYERNIL